MCRYWKFAVEMRRYRALQALIATTIFIDRKNLSNNYDEFTIKKNTRKKIFKRINTGGTYRDKMNKKKWRKKRKKRVD